MVVVVMVVVVMVVVVVVDSGSDREMVDSCLHAYQVYCQQGRKQYLVPSWYGLSTCVPNHPSHNPKP
jgi:ABC-type lipoprotein release transport system permease subunit